MNLRKRLYELMHMQPYGTEDLVLLKNVIIPYEFSNKQPKQWKISRVVDYYNENNCVDKPISVVKVPSEKTGKCKYLLTDEYTRYLFLKSQNKKFIPVKYIEILS